MMEISTEIVLLIIGFCAAWAAAVVFLALVIAWQIVGRMQPGKAPEANDAWRDM